MPHLTPHIQYLILPQKLNKKQKKKCWRKIGEKQEQGVLAKKWRKTRTGSTGEKLAKNKNREYWRKIGEKQEEELVKNWRKTRRRRRRRSCGCSCFLPFSPIFARLDSLKNENIKKQ